MTPTLSIMKPAPESRPPGTDEHDVAIVLLVLQSAIGMLSVLGSIVIGAATGALPVLAGAIALGLFGPAAALVLAAGIGHRKRWARNGVVLFEGIVLLGELVRLLIGRGVAVQLVPLLTACVLPVVVLRLTMSKPSRRAFSRAARSDRSPVQAPNWTEVERAA